MTTAAKHATSDAAAEPARHARVAPPVAQQVAPQVASRSRRAAAASATQLEALVASAVRTAIKELRTHPTELAILAGTVVTVALLGLCGVLLLVG